MKSFVVKLCKFIFSNITFFKELTLRLWPGSALGDYGVNKLKFTLFEYSLLQHKYYIQPL